MTSGLTRWVSTIAGLIATFAGTLVLVSLPPGEATPEPSPAIVSEVNIDEDSTMDEAIELVAPNLPRVGGVSTAVSDALTESGYTEFLDVDSLSDMLPTSVIDVLIAEGAVLVVPDEGGR